MLLGKASNVVVLDLIDVPKECNSGFGLLWRALGNVPDQGESFKDSSEASKSSFFCLKTELLLESSFLYLRLLSYL
ncbi:hypothetical protein Tco_1238991 [Tanacetum coccineum]